MADGLDYASYTGVAEYEVEQNLTESIKTRRCPAKPLTSIQLKGGCDCEVGERRGLANHYEVYDACVV